MKVEAIVCATEAEWLEERRKSIGGSDAPSALGISPWRSALELYLDKRGDLEPEESKLRWRTGHALEPLLAAEAEDELGMELWDPGDFTIYRPEEYPGSHATLDRLAYHSTSIAPPVRMDSQTDRGVAEDVCRHALAEADALVELKTVEAMVARAWEDELPEYYELQVQHQLAVTGIKRGYLVALIGLGSQGIRVFEIEANESVGEHLLTLEGEFMACVRDGVPPPADGSDSARDALRLMYPQEQPGKVVELDPSMEVWLDVMAEGADLERQGKAAQERAKAAIQEQMQDAERAYIRGKKAWQWKLEKKKGYVVKPSETRVFRAARLRKEEQE